MSFQTAKTHFQKAASTTEDEAQREIAEGLAELAKTLQRELQDFDSRIRSIEQQVRHLR